MTIQDDIWLQSEGDAYFKRNSTYIDPNDWDYSSWLISHLGDRKEIKSVCDLGGSNGYFLDLVREQFSPECQFYCVDVSKDAIEDGKQKYPYIHYGHGPLNNIPIKDQSFRLVIINGVLCWIDRKSLAKSVAEIDRLVADGGYLVIGDFLPNFPQRRKYHHNKVNKLYTYKQDYGRLFQALGIYGEIARITFNHDNPKVELEYTPPGYRYVSVLLRKSFSDYYLEL